MAGTQLFQNSREHVAYVAGQSIFNAGDPGDVMYVVQTGTVEIIAAGQVITTVEPGGIFGEMALIDHEPRSAGAVAKTDCTVMPVDEQRFLFSIQNNPFFALEVLRTLAGRLRNMTAV